MSVYHWLVILIIGLAVLLRGNRPDNKFYIVLAVALLFCVYGLRDCYTIGGDSSSSYFHQFQRMEHTEWKDLPNLSDWLHIGLEDETGGGRSRNIGLPILMKLVFNWTDGDYQVLIVLIAAFVMIAFAFFIQRFSTSPVQSILYYFGLLFYTFNFSSLKQSVSMAIILLSFDSIMKKRPISFTLTVLAASIFHFPALIFLPAYLIVNRKLKTSFPLLLMGLFIFTYIFRDTLVSLMADVYETTIYSRKGRFLANKVLIMLFIFSAAYIIRPPNEDDRMYIGLLRFLGIAAVIQTFSSYNNTFERLADYYFQFSVILLPMIFEPVVTEKRYLNNRNLYLARLAGPIFCCAFAVWRFLSIVTGDWTLYPYRFFFE